MRKFLSLTKVLLKCSLGMLSDGKSKKGMTIFLYSIIAVSCLPLVAMLYFMIRPTLDIMGSMGQAGTVLGAMMFMAASITLVFSIFIIPSIFYFSSDSNILLSLPLKPEQILGSKFVVCLVYEYIFTIGVLLPTYFAYIDYAGVSFAFILSGSIAILLIPVYPLVIGTVITILVMRFVPFFKNRDRFNLIAGILTLVLAFGFSFVMNTMGPGQGGGDPNAILATFLQGNNSMLDMFMKAFPMIPFFSRAMVNGNYLDLLIGIGIIALSILVLLTLGKFLYFKGAIGYGETSTSTKKLSDSDLAKANRSHSKIYTYAIKDMKILIRTPIFFLNCVCTCFVVPFLTFLLPMITGSKGSSNGVDMDAILQMIKDMPDITAYVIILSLGIGFLIGGMNMVSATAISREGKDYTIMKSIPMPYKDQIHAKALCGIVLSIITVAFTLLPIYIMIPFPIHYVVIIFLCGSISSVVVNYVGIMLDLSHPKLVWEQEAAAVKQNMAGVTMMFACMLMFGLSIGLCFMVSSDHIMIIAILSTVVILFLIGATYILSGKYAETAMRKL